MFRAGGPIPGRGPARCGRYRKYMSISVSICPYLSICLYLLICLYLCISVHFCAYLCISVHICSYPKLDLLKKTNFSRNFLILKSFSEKSFLFAPQKSKIPLSTPGIDPRTFRIYATALTVALTLL